MRKSQRTACGLKGGGGLGCSRAWSRFPAQSRSHRLSVLCLNFIWLWTGDISLLPRAQRYGA